MGSIKPEIAHEIFPYLIEYKDGTIERLVGTEQVPPSLDSETEVLSKDILIFPETNVSARFYLPKTKPNPKHKLPLLIYFHGGAYVIASPSEPKYHTSLNQIAAGTNSVAMSVDYRLAPEHPLPVAYEDSWAVLQWVFSSYQEEDWLKEYVDMDRVFLIGDSAGANIAHHMALRIDPTRKMKFAGIVSIHPYFWGEKPIGLEVEDHGRKSMVDKWWLYVCPSDKGNDDPLINPFVDGAPSVAGLACDRVLVCVAEKDILRDRGRLYYDKLKKSGWKGEVEFTETEGEDHVFHVFDPYSEKAKKLIKDIASFVNKQANY